MRRRVVAFLLIVTLGMQNSIPVGATEISASLETGRTSNMVAEEIVNEVGLSSEGQENFIDDSAEVEENNVLVLDESNSAFFAGIPTIEYFDNAVENESSGDEELGSVTDDFIMDSEVVGDSASEKDESIAEQRARDEEVWTENAKTEEFQAGETQTEEFQTGDGQAEEETGVPAQGETNQTEQSGLFLSVSDAWVMDQSEEKNIIPVEDNQIDLTDFSAVQTKKIGYSLELRYRQGEYGRIAAGDEFIMELPSRYLEYEDIAQTPLLLQEEQDGSKKEAEKEAENENENENSDGNVSGNMQPVRVGTYEVTEGQLKLVFDDTLTAAAFLEGSGQVELCGSLKYEALYTNMQTKETVVLPEYVGGCRVWTNLEIALTFPVMDAVNGLEQSCEFDEERGIYVWSVTVGSLTPGLTLADYGLEDTVDTEKMQIVSAEAENESLAYTETEDGIRFLLPADALTPYTVRIGVKPSHQMESTEAHEEAYTNTVCLSHTWLQENDKLQWKSVETCKLQSEAPSMSKEFSMPEAVPAEVVEEADGETMSAYGAETDEGAVVPPLTDWEWKYQTIDDVESIVLTQYIGTSEVISIPISYGVSPVSLGFALFKGNQTIRKVIFPEKTICLDLTSLFEGCRNLEEVVNLEYQRDVFKDLSLTFYGCSSLKKVSAFPADTERMGRTFWLCTELETIPELPSSVMFLKGTFDGCRSLREMPALPASVISLEEAFNDCSGLEKVSSIPDSVTNMNNTFAGCTSLEIAPKLPASVEDINGTFSDCSSLKTVPDIICSATGLYHTFSGCISMEKAPNILTPVTSLAYTFEKCTLLKEVEIPNTVTNLGYTFADCISMEKTPEIGPSVVGMEGTFSGCTALKEITNIPDSVTNMVSTFKDCVSLVEMPTIPATVTDLSDTFSGCTSLKRVSELPDSLRSMNRTFQGCTSLEEAPVLPHSIISLNSAFENCMLKEAPKLPDSVTDIGDTFKDCYALEKAPDIPPSVTNMYRTFNGCRSLKGEMTIYCKTEINNKVNFLNGHQYFFHDAAINTSGLVVHYCDSNADIIDEIIATKSANSKITKGNCVEVPVKYTVSLAEKDEHLLLVTDTAGRPLQDVEVIYGALEHEFTNKNGEVRLRFTDEMLAGVSDLNDSSEEELERMHTLQLIKTGYLTQVREKYVFDSADTSPLIRMLKIGEESLSSAVMSYDGEEYDILEHDATIDVNSVMFGSTRSFDLFFTTTDRNTDQYTFIIKQGEKKISTNDETGTFHLKCSDFEAEEDATLIYVDKETKAVVKTEKLRLKFIDSAELPLTFEIGDDLSFRIPDDIPIVGGQEISMKSAELPVEFSFDASGKVHIGLNMDTIKSECGVTNTEKGSTKKNKWEKDSIYDRWAKVFDNKSHDILDWDELQELAEERMKEKGKVTSIGALSISYNWGGYLEGSLNDFDALAHDVSAFRNLSGGIFGEMKIKVSAEVPFAVYVPFYVPCVAAFEGGGGVKATAEWNNGFTASLEPSIELTAFAGPGWPDFVAAGFYGEAKSEMKVLLTPTNNVSGGLKEWTISGNAGTKVIARGKDYFKHSFIDGTYYIIKNDELSMASLDPIDLQDQIMETITDEDIVTELSRDYLPERSAWQSTVTDAVNEPQILQSNTYMDIQPTLLSAAGGEIMVWADDLGDSRDSANRTAVVYSVFDEAASAWSEPMPLEDDGTADFSPAVYSDGTDVYVIWQDAKEPLKSEMTLSEQSDLLELNTAKLDLAGRSCELLGTITDNSEFELSPRLSVIDGQLTAGWYTNSEGNPLGAVGRNMFYSAIYHDGLWSQPQSLVESGIVMSETAEILNGTAYTAIVEDTDMDLMTMDDRCLYLLEEATKEKIEISSDITGRVCSALVGGKRAFCWAEGSTMRYLASLEEGVQTLLEDSIASGCDYQVFGDENGNMTILYFVLQDSQTKLMAQNYDPTGMVWGEPAVLVSNGKYVERASGYYENGRLVLAYTQTEVTDMQKLDTVCDFCYMVLEGKPNVVIEDVRYDEYGVEPGGDLNLTICVKNTGSEIARNVSAEILDEAGTVAGTTAVGQDIVGGGSAKLEYVLKLPEDGGPHRYSVRAGASTFDLTVGQGKLVVIAEKEEYSTAGMLAVHVRNVGLSPAGGTLEIYDPDKQDAVYLTEEIPKLAAGDTYLYRCLDSSLYPVDDKRHTIVVRVTCGTGTDTDFLTLDPVIYTITFNQGEYGNNEKTEEKVKRGSLMTEPDINEDIIGWYLDPELTTEWNFSVAVTGDMMLYAKWNRCEVHEFHMEAVAPTCTEQGYTLYSCVNCPYTYQDDFVEALGHNWEKYVEEPTCVEDGVEGQICQRCKIRNILNTMPKSDRRHQFESRIVAPTCAQRGYTEYICTICAYTYRDHYVEMIDHDWKSYVKEATCVENGEEGKICKKCQKKEVTKIISKTGHKWDSGKIIQEATVFQPAVRTKICSVCKTQSETEEGSPLKATMTLTANSLPMKLRQKTTALKVTNMSNGDYLKSVIPNKTSLVKVSNVKKNGTFKLTAKNKTGTAKLTIKLASGLSKTVTIKIQKETVKTKKISGLKKKLTVEKGRTMKIRPVLNPLTSQQKVKFHSSNKKIASVSSKGVIKGLKPGKAKITVSSGKRKFVCTVTVKK